MNEENTRGGWTEDDQNLPAEETTLRLTTTYEGATAFVVDDRS
jgi:hypothetical protein